MCRQKRDGITEVIYLLFGDIDSTHYASWMRVTETTTGRGEWKMNLHTGKKARRKLTSAVLAAALLVSGLP